MDTIDYRRMMTLIGAFALVGCGIIGLVAGDSARMIQVGLLGLSSVIVPIFVFHLAEYYGAEKQHSSGL